MASHPRAFNAQVWQRWVPLAACPRGAELSPATWPGNLLPGPLPSLGPQAQNPGRERRLGPLFLWGNLLSALSPVRSVTSKKGPVEPSTNSPSGWQGRRWGGCLAGLWPACRERHVCHPPIGAAGTPWRKGGTQPCAGNHSVDLDDSCGRPSPHRHSPPSNPWPLHHRSQLPCVFLMCRAMVLFP